jgi:hypothetical protein
MVKVSTILILLWLTSTAWAQGPKRYPWQAKDSDCNQYLTFCWYGEDVVSDPEVTAHGSQWVSQDKEEKPFDWITEVRCIKQLRVCILARNQSLIFGGGTATNIDMYRVQEWSEFQIRAIGENDFPAGKECEIDSLLLNRAEGSVSMLSVPGPAATEKRCNPFGDPKAKTVVYSLELGPPKPQQDKK